MKYLVYTILTLIMGTLAFGVYLYKQKISTEISLIDHQQVIESKTGLEWETYESDLYNFSFEYPKEAFISKSIDSTDSYLRIQNFDPEGDFTVDTVPDSEYWMDFLVYQKKPSLTLVSCNDLLVENYTASGLGKYKVYKGVAKVDEGSDLISTCFERPDYTLLVHGIDFNHTGNNVMNHLLESLKFAE